MKVLLLSAEPANRECLVQFMRSVIEGELEDQFVLKTVTYSQVPTEQPPEPFDFVVVDALEDPSLKTVMDTITGWTNRPVILGYYIGNKRYVESTMVELGATACLTVNPSRVAVPMNHVPFFREHFSQRLTADVA